MIFDIQKASFLKRISAFILDFILLLILITGSAWILSIATDYKSHTNAIEQKKIEYQNLYSDDTFKVDFNIKESDFLELTIEQQQKINNAYAKFSEDKEVIKEYNVLYSLMLMITSISIFIACFILEFILPLILKNGQTVGKKVFGIAVMHTNSVKLSHLALFARSILGKYTIETMIPIAIAIMIYFGFWGLGGTAILLLFLAVQITVLCVSKNNSCLHDLIAGTVAVDMQSQMIFENEEKMLEYKKAEHAKKVEKSVY